MKHRTNIHRKTLTELSDTNLLKKQASLFMQPQYYHLLYTISCKTVRLALMLELYRDLKKKSLNLAILQLFF